MGTEYQWEPAGKPGSVPAERVAPSAPAAIPLGRDLRHGSSHLPASSAEPAWSACCALCDFIHTALAYLVLLRMEVAAFHPSGFEARGLVSVALFVASPRQGVTLHPALRSPDFPLWSNERHSGCLADSRCNFTAAGGT